MLPKLEERVWERSPFSKVPERCEQKNKQVTEIRHRAANGFFFFLTLQMQCRQFKEDLCCRLRKSLLERKKTVLISVQLARGWRRTKDARHVGGFYGKLQS